MNVCPAITDALGWLPWVLLLAGLFDTAMVFGAAVFVRRKR